MRVPVQLADSFKKPFEDEMARFLAEKGWIASVEDLHSKRFLTRSILPHASTLSRTFNRLDEDADGLALGRYWTRREGKSSNPKNLRLAYFLTFAPSNMARMAAVLAELHRLGYEWEGSPRLRAIEFGAGPATGISGCAVARKLGLTTLPERGDVALIEQDGPLLELGVNWLEHLGAQWDTRPFRRAIDPSRPLLPANAPKFNLWLSSFFLNELRLEPRELAALLMQNWEKHLEEEGLIVIVEPALKLLSRKLLELRRELIPLFEKSGRYQILLPCLGHQACGALAEPEDWCHEEILWWRPEYLKMLDTMLGQDRRTLAFSYLVIAKTRKESNPLNSLSDARSLHRLVSPSHAVGKDMQFYLCGKEGKLRAHIPERDLKEPLGRGDILANAELRGDPASTRVEKFHAPRLRPDAQE